MANDTSKIQYAMGRDEYVGWIKGTLDSLCHAVNIQLFEGCRDWYWVGEHHGGICCFDDTDYLHVEDMILILEENVSFDQYAEWHCAELDHPDQHINLRSWLMGARHDVLKMSNKAVEKKARDAFHAINDEEYKCALAESQYSEQAFNQVKKEYDIAETAFVQGAMWAKTN